MKKILLFNKPWLVTTIVAIWVGFSMWVGLYIGVVILPPTFWSAVASSVIASTLICILLVWLLYRRANGIKE